MYTFLKNFLYLLHVYCAQARTKLQSHFYRKILKFRARLWPLISFQTWQGSTPFFRRFLLHCNVFSCVPSYSNTHMYAHVIANMCFIRGANMRVFHYRLLRKKRSLYLLFRAPPEKCHVYRRAEDRRPR